MTLLVSASISMAADCADDPNECTLKKLCEIATAFDGSNTIWEIKSASSKHVKIAKDLGLKCGITPVIDACDINPSDCKLKQLCVRATKEMAGRKTWDNMAAAYVDLAKEYGLQCDVKEDAVSGTSTGDFKRSFLSEPKLKRQQLQYALKELGLYSFGTDGLWGNGTSSAFDEFVQVYNLQNISEVDVFARLLAKVTVPSSFAAKKKKVVEAPKIELEGSGLISKYVCETSKVDFKSPVFSFSTNNGMTSATLTIDGQRRKITGNDLRKALKDLNIDQQNILRLTQSKVTFLALNWEKKIEGFFKGLSASDEVKLRKIVDQLATPIKFYKQNGLVTWSQKMPKEFGLGAGTVSHSFNPMTKQYVAKTAIKPPGETDTWRVNVWATCNPS